MPAIFDRLSVTVGPFWTATADELVLNALVDQPSITVKITHHGAVTPTVVADGKEYLEVLLAMECALAELAEVDPGRSRADHIAALRERYQVLSYLAADE